MPYGLYISAEGAYSQSKRMEVLANNLANVDTPGFKRDLALCQARYAEETLARARTITAPASINDVGGGVWMNRTVTDHSQGTLKRTEHPHRHGRQRRRLFRRAERWARTFSPAPAISCINTAGMLVTQTGMPVMSEAGTPILVNPDTPWRVSPDGAIEQDGGKTYLALVQPPSPADLVKHGENLFQPLAPPAAVPPELRNVREGYLEMSGVRPTLEMLELIETSRAFEMNVSMIRNHDAMLNSLVNRVLRQALVIWSPGALVSGDVRPDIQTLGLARHLAAVRVYDIQQLTVRTTKQHRHYHERSNALHRSDRHGVAADQARRHRQ